jgi:hypothetical protein
VAVKEGKSVEDVLAAEEEGVAAPKSNPAEAAGAVVAGVDPKPPNRFDGAPAAAVTGAPNGFVAADVATGAEPNLQIGERGWRTVCLEDADMLSMMHADSTRLTLERET